MPPRYKDLEQYGIVGNLETCALVADDGSVDWLCFPYLDSPFAFAALLDKDKGGEFAVAPESVAPRGQSYVTSTNVLRTEMEGRGGRVAVVDAMPVRERGDAAVPRAILRSVEGLEGEVDVGVTMRPRFEHARTVPRFEASGRDLRCSAGRLTLTARAPASWTVGDDGAARAAFRVRGGESRWVTLRDGPEPLDDAACGPLFQKTLDFWRGWTRERAGEPGVDRPPGSILERSGLAMKLLENPKTGAIAAAATTSLPEKIGGPRNWDYRFAWVRDVSLTFQALYHLGHHEERAGYRRWIEAVVRHVGDPARLGTIYGVRDEWDLTERTLDHLAGWKDSRPVRIGNLAATQRQHDIFGELAMALYEVTRYGEDLAADIWEALGRMIDHVARVWHTPDSGIWEMRTPPKHFVHSKVMCWAALDRAIAIAGRRPVAPARLASWTAARAEVRRAVEERGYSRRLGSFVMALDGEDLDAATLLIPIVGFLPASDPRVRGTIDAVMGGLARGGLVRRYDVPDGLPDGEGAFLACSFWLVKALALSGRRDEAEGVLSDALSHMGPLGLLSEEIDLDTGRMVGNFPQAFSHVGLVNSSLYLAIAAGGESRLPRPMGMTGSRVSAGK